MTDVENPPTESDPTTENSQICEESGKELGERLLFLQNKPETIIQLGCSSESLTNLFQSSFPDSLIHTIHDFGTAGAGWEESYVSEFDRLPVENDSASLVVSNLSSLFNRPENLFVECYRMLRDNGVLLFSMCGSGSFQELTSACKNVGIEQVQNQLPEMHAVGDLLLSNGYTNPVVDIDYQQATFEDVPALVSNLNQSYTYSMLVRNPNQLSSKRVQSELTEQFKEIGQSSKITMTLEIIYGIAWKKRFDPFTAHVHFEPN